MPLGCEIFPDAVLPRRKTLLETVSPLLSYVISKENAPNYCGVINFVLNMQVNAGVGLRAYVEPADGKCKRYAYRWVLELR